MSRNNIFRRFQHKCKSILDLILVSGHDKISQSGVWPHGIRDHMAIYCTRKVKRSDIKNKHKSNSKLNKINWFEILNLKTAKETWLKFKQIFTSVINELAPIKSVRVKQRSQFWFTGEILDTI